MWYKVTACKAFWTTVATVGMTLLVASGACSPASPSDTSTLTGVDESVSSNEEGLSGSLPSGSSLKTTANLNFRTGPSTGYKVLRVLATGAVVTVVEPTPSNGFYKVTHNGTNGWAHGGYMTVVSTPSGSAGVSGPVAVGTVLETVTDLNLRSGPSTSNAVLEVMAAGSLVAAVAKDPENSFYKVDHNGTVGWSHGGYLRASSSSGSSSPSGSSSKVDAAIGRAKAGVGFSYWWGHARWLAGGPSSSTKGSCSGSCPSCSHSGSYGADCSGYVGKIWQVPSNNTDLTYDWHPYSTSTFVGSSSLWTTVSRSSVKKADALVYNSGGAGHIFLYESGDGWGSMWAYECKGCSAGCVRNLRTASSAYKGIRRSGY
jgi:uncharacterized protein YgiM (DUF1202 family)